MIVILYIFTYDNNITEMEVCPMINTNGTRDSFFTQVYISSEARFYSIKDVMEMTGWSEGTVQKLFNDPKFPSADYGKTKVVEVHALIQFFSVPHNKERERYWQPSYVHNRVPRR